VEKTQDLAHKIAEAKAAGAPGNGKKAAKGAEGRAKDAVAPAKEAPSSPLDRIGGRPSRIGSFVTVPIVAGATDTGTQAEASLMQKFNEQFEHFGDDAPACDICGSITVRNGTCYKCFNCGNSMGCS